MAPFTSPATVLKTAESLVSINQPHAALQTLAETFSSKRFRNTPLPSLEPVVLRFIELAVELRKGRTAKEGLMQYKNVAQAVDVNSIQMVVAKFIGLADAKVADAIAHSTQQNAALDVDDLEASETPESILLGAVSAASQSRERTDRVLVTPWLKFLWEAYRTSLEVLKNSARLEPIYQQIARQAFQFCLTHTRKVEFRRLCETLRLHLSNVTKYAPPPGSTQPQHANAINLNDPAVLQSHLDTRLVQLKNAVELELWQESFRSLEDVHHLLLLSSNKDPSLGLSTFLSSPVPSTSTKPAAADKARQQRLQMLANYYQKCTRIFLMSGSSTSSASSAGGGGGALFHAAAWTRYWTVLNLLDVPPPQEELSAIAAQVVVSALAVPITSSSSTSSASKTSRLTALLGLTSLPTRKGLLTETRKSGALELSPPAVKKLHGLLVVSFDPLSLGSSIASVLNELVATEEGKEGENIFTPYVPLLERAVLSRLMKHLGEVYESIKLDSVYQLVKPLADRYPQDESTLTLFAPTSLEAYIISSARRGEIGVRIDHKSNSLIFIDDAYTVSAFSPLPTEEQIQVPLSSLVRTRLSSIGTALSKSLHFLEPQSENDRAGSQQTTFKELLSEVEKERKSLVLKRALIQRRRELLSELSVRKEAEDVAARAERQRREREQREARELKERREREINARNQELEKIRKDEFIKQAKALLDKGAISKEVVESMNTHDTGELLTFSVKQFESEKKEMTSRLRLLAKKIDHTERAYRLLSLPLLAEDYEKQREDDQKTHILSQQSLLAESKREHERALRDKERLGRIRPDFESRSQEIIGKRKELFKKREKQAKEKMEREKEKRRQEYIQLAEEEERERAEEERRRREEEEEQIRMEEERLAEESRIAAEAEAAREAEERKKKEAEAAAAAAREERERERAAALEKARLQQQREEEAEARRLARKAEANKPPSAPSPIKPAAEGGAWRRSALRRDEAGSGGNTPNTSAPATPVRASHTPERSESPAPAVGRYRPGQGFGGAAAATTTTGAGSGGGSGGGWREREAARRAAGANGGTDSGANTPARAESPAPPTKDEKDDDGFTTVTRPTAHGSGAQADDGEARG